MYGEYHVKWLKIGIVIHRLGELPVALKGIPLSSCRNGVWCEVGMIVANL